jgi:hypothetical protein
MSKLQKNFETELGAVLDIFLLKELKKKRLPLNCS